MTERNYRSRLAVGPDAVANVVRRAMTASRSQARYLVTPAAKVLVHTRRLGGDRIWDSAVRRSFRLPA